ncbi:MAG TPA: hypothetical protein VKZ79_13190 [Alphaproteobacteria bacterium]|nr:hypothetical protein [Alphaproteobacteria bacterium]
MAALNHHSATRTAFVLSAAFLIFPAFGWAKDIPDQKGPDPKGQAENPPAQNLPPEAQPKAPAPGETKTGVIRPPDVDPDMSKRTPNVDPKMAQPPKPQAPAVPEMNGGEQGQGKSGPEAQPR